VSVANAATVVNTFGLLKPPIVANPGSFEDLFPLTGLGAFFGLAFFGGDKGYGPDLFYTIQGNTSSYFFQSINVPTSSNAPRFSTGASKDIFTLTFAAPDLGYGSDIFYYLRTDPTHNNISVFGYITPGAPNVGVSTDLIVNSMAAGFDSLTFAAANVGYGAYKMFFLRHNATTCVSHFGVIDPSTLTWEDIMLLGPNYDAIYFTVTDVGYGVNMFYYLRHNSTTNISTFGTLDIVNKITTDRYVLAKFYNQIVFTTVDVGFGPNLFYFIHGSPFVPCTAH